MQLRLHYINYTTPQLQLHYTTTTAALHHTTSSSCGWGDRPGDHCNHCNHSKNHSSNHLSVHRWIRSAIRDSQQPTSPIGFLLLKLPPPPCALLLVTNSICDQNLSEDLLLQIIYLVQNPIIPLPNECSSREVCSFQMSLHVFTMLFISIIFNNFHHFHHFPFLH